MGPRGGENPSSTPESVVASEEDKEAEDKKKDETSSEKSKEEKSKAAELTPQERRRRGSNKRDPFWRNRVNTETREETVPEASSINLEREKNYSRNEEINHLIQRVRSGEWQEYEENQRLQQRYGRAGALRHLREWLGGEYDFTYDQATGTMQHHWRTELARRAAHIGINTAETAGIMLAAGALTGGVGAAFGGALIGSTLGRGFAQAWRGISGTERGMREDLEISRVRYYQKAKELADRIGPEEPTEELNPEGESRYQTERNDAVRDLVNFVNSSEQHGVAIRLTGEEGSEGDDEERQGLRSRITNFFRSSGGRPYIRGGAQDEPIEPQIGPGEPMGGGPSGPSMVTGTEVYQPSEVIPTRQTLDDMEKNFEHYRRRWEWIEAGMALVGGLAGGAGAILESKKGIAQAATDKLARGEIVKLDVDGVNGAHGVQRVTEAMKNMWNISSEYIFHYNAASEALREGAANAQILPHGQFGSHVLEGAKTVGGAINKEALHQAARGAIGMFAGLFAHTAWRGAANDRQHERHGREREEMKQEQEILRRRLQPETKATQPETEIKDKFFEANKPFPEQGQDWMWNGNRISIENVDDSDPNKIIIRVVKENQDHDYDEVMVIPAESLLSDDSVCIRKRKGGKRDKKEELLNVDLDEDRDEDDEEFESETGAADTVGGGTPPSKLAGDRGPTVEDLREAQSGVPKGSYDSSATVTAEAEKNRIMPGNRYEVMISAQDRDGSYMLQINDAPRKVYLDSSGPPPAEGETRTIEITKERKGDQAIFDAKLLDKEDETGERSQELNFEGIFDKGVAWKPRPDRKYFRANLIRSNGMMKVGERVNINGGEIFHIEEVVKGPKEGIWLARFTREGETDITYEMNIRTFVKYANPDIGVKINEEQVNEADRHLDEYVENYIKGLDKKGEEEGADLATRRRGEGKGEIGEEGAKGVGSEGATEPSPEGAGEPVIGDIEAGKGAGGAVIDRTSEPPSDTPIDRGGAEPKPDVTDEVTKAGPVKIEIASLKPGGEVVPDEHIPSNIRFVDENGVLQNLEQYVRTHQGQKYIYKGSEHGEVVIGGEGEGRVEEIRILEDDFKRSFLTEQKQEHPRNGHSANTDEESDESDQDTDVVIKNWAFMNERGERIFVQPGQTWEWEIGTGDEKTAVEYKVSKLTGDKMAKEISITFEGEDPVIRRSDTWRQIFENAELKGRL